MTNVERDVITPPRISLFPLVVLFAAQIFFISTYLLYFNHGADVPFLINSKSGDKTARLLMLIVCIPCVIYCVAFYISIFHQKSYPKLDGVKKYLPAIPLISFVITIIFILSIVSPSFTFAKFGNSLIAISDISSWASYTDVDVWPSVTVFLFGFALSTCMSISNITVSTLHFDKSQREELKDYIFWLHLSIASIACLYGFILYGTNAEFFNPANIDLSITKEPNEFQKKFIFIYAGITIIYILLVFLLPAIFFNTLDSGAKLKKRIAGLSMPAWLLPINDLMIKTFPQYKEISTKIGVYFEKIIT